jgi:hypothetical protein
VTTLVNIVPPVRRQFALPEDDAAHLDARGFSWETIVSEGERWLFIHDFPVPSGYVGRLVTVAIQITAGYPTAALDMVYVHPALARTDGRAIGALTTMIIDAKSFQRWSRHRTNENPWRPGVDDLAAHLALIEEWFVREFRGR